MSEGGIITSESRERKKNVNAASAFARAAMGHLGGSSVYIEPKKTKTKLFDADKVE
jgi:hypothetical protein